MIELENLIDSEATRGLFGYVCPCYELETPVVQLHFEQQGEEQDFFFREGENQALEFCHKHKMNPDIFEWIYHEYVMH